MSELSPSMPIQSIQKSKLHLFFKEASGLLAFNALLWWLIPGFALGNLHVDTLEAAFWTHDLAFGYWKHPPLLTWLIDLVFVPGPLSILSILFLSQIITITTAFFIWQTAAEIAGREASRLALILFLTSPLASFYALQVNHNTVLAPFIAGTIYLGYRYLETRSLKSNVALGVAIGLGLLAKYEIIFAVIPLLSLAILIPRYRENFLILKSYLAILIVIAFAAPHLIWLSANDWPSFKHAIDSAPMATHFNYLESLWGFFWGLMTVIATPLLLLKVIKFDGINALREKPKNEIQKIGQIITLVPLLGLIAASLVTGQFVKALWLLPLGPAIAIGLGIIGRGVAINLSEKLNKIAVSGMTALFGLFWFYLSVGDVIARPHEAFFANTKTLASQVENLWTRHQNKPLTCLIVNEQKIGASPFLWLSSRPLVLETPATPWGTKDHLIDCVAKGAIAINLNEGAAIERFFPRLCLKTFEPIKTASLLGLNKDFWPGHIAYLPPEGEACPQTE
ncbi:MAG: glycosyltransferase family 39 protein [Alphaproteobacteria bacterium]|nr:glycosyltransferase family 39 protein [Alphaproteobacteria bacterium]